MKIGLVTGEYPPMQGGVGAFTQELAKAFHNSGQEIHIITDRQARPPDHPRIISRVVEPIELPYAKLHPQIRSWRWSSLAKIVDIILRNDLDIVNIQYQAAAYNMKSPAINLLPWRIKALTNTIITFHDLRVPYLFPKAGIIRQKAITFMTSQATGAIVTNQDDFEDLSQTTDTPVSQIPIGSNIDTYTPNHLEIAEVQREINLGSDDLLLGYFGFLNESKGADILLGAFSKLTDRFQLAFIGGQTGSSDLTNAAFLDSISAQVESLGLSNRIHWTGFISDVRVSTFLHTAEIMIMPYRDGVSLRRGTLMAILAHGRPLITTRPTKPIPELIHGNNIWFVPPNDELALVQAIKTLAADKQKRDEIGQAAAEVAKSFNWESIAAKTISFFEERARLNRQK